MSSFIQTFEGHTPDINSSAWIHPTALVIGDVTIGANSSVWPMAVIRGDIHKIRIGHTTNIQDGSILHVTHDSQFVPGGYPLIIGNNIIIGHQVVLHGCEIQDYCLIGIGVRVLDGAIIEPYSFIGAGSLVPPGKRLSSGSLWLGSPVRCVRALTDKERANIEYSAKHYANLAAKYAKNNSYSIP